MFDFVGIVSLFLLLGTAIRSHRKQFSLLLSIRDVRTCSVAIVDKNTDTSSPWLCSGVPGHVREEKTKFSKSNHIHWNVLTLLGTEHHTRLQLRYGLFFFAHQFALVNSFQPVKLLHSHRMQYALMHWKSSPINIFSCVFCFRFVFIGDAGPMAVRSWRSQYCAVISPN